jgi:uncharacterized membrane protein
VAQLHGVPRHEGPAAARLGLGAVALEWLLVASAGAAALVFRPWSVLRDEALRNAWFGAVALLAAGWSAQVNLPGEIPVVLSGACLLVLMFGWPLAVLTVIGLAAAATALAGATPGRGAELAAWSGALPATLALGIGLAMRRWLPRNAFVYILGRAFVGTAAATLLAAALHVWWVQGAQRSESMLVTAGWLVAWGEAFLTGALAAVFVAFRPQWLLTWSDARYLPPPVR